ncbi:MAG: glycosyltransferase family 4 protein [Thermoleophilia bacterium]|nr:glycosyltransferase family 4 protein [Thermoleophilia bacterium]
MTDTSRVRLLVIYQHAPTPGAPGIYRHRTLLAELVRRGWDVDLVSSPINYMHGEVPTEYRGANRLQTEVIDGITHHWVRATGNVHKNMKWRALNYVTFAVTSLVRGGTLPRPDVIWASSPPLSIASVGRALARRFGRPWVFEVRDLWPETASAAGLLGEDTALYRTIDRLARTYAREADGVLVPTPILAEQVKEHGARDVSLVTGVIEDHPPDPAVRAAMRERLGVRDQDCLFAYVGSHGIIYGLDRLLDAAEIAANQRAAAIASGEAADDASAIRIVLAGDGSARETLAVRLAERPIAGVTMLGPVPKADVFDILAGADVGLHILKPAPLFEGALPTKALEYLGAHLPFITTVPGLPKSVALASGGGFADGADALAIELARWTAMTADERRGRGERAYAYGQENFGLAASVDRLEALLLSTIRPRSWHSGLRGRRGRRARRATGFGDAQATPPAVRGKGTS